MRIAEVLDLNPADIVQREGVSPVMKKRASLERHGVLGCIKDHLIALDRHGKNGQRHAGAQKQCQQSGRFSAEQKRQPGSGTGHNTNDQPAPKQPGCVGQDQLTGQVAQNGHALILDSRFGPRPAGLMYIEASGSEKD